MTKGRAAFAGVRRVGWDEFGELCRDLALAVSGFNPEIVVGIARGGVVPGVVVASMLQREFFSVRISRRHDGELVRRQPELLQEFPPQVLDRRVLIVDDLAVTGATLDLAHAHARALGAAEVRTCCLFLHRGTYRPDYAALVSDELHIPPWDRVVLRQGRFVQNPAYEALMDIAVASTRPRR